MNFRFIQFGSATNSYYIFTKIEKDVCVLVGNFYIRAGIFSIPTLWSITEGIITKNTMYILDIHYGGSIDTDINTDTDTYYASCSCC